MNSKSVVKTSKVIKDMTTNVREHFDVFDRARDLFLSQIKRAEADYFERIRRATAILAGEVETETKVAEPPQPGAPIQ